MGFVHFYGTVFLMSYSLCQIKFGEDRLGMSRSMGALLVTIMGASSTGGRIIAGMIASTGRGVGLWVVAVGGVSIAGVTLAMVPVCTNAVSLAVVLGIACATSAFIPAVTPAILHAAVDSEDVPKV